MTRAAPLLALLALLPACQGKREPDVAQGLGAGGVRAVPVSTLHPGPAAPIPAMRNPYEGNDEALAEGRRLFIWYNCAGCHGADGGGGIGPPFVDADWIYGGGAGQVFLSIVQGRPNGMPSFGRRITEEQVWKITAYVESLGGEVAATGGQEDVRNPEGYSDDPGT